MLELMELHLKNPKKAREILEQMKSVGDLSPEQEMCYRYMRGCKVGSSYAMPPPGAREKLLEALRKSAWRDSHPHWRQMNHPDVIRMANTMNCLKTDERLLEYTKETPPPSIFEDAINVYKKCVSFKSKNTKKIDSILKGNSRCSVLLCIDWKPVDCFLREFHSWNSRACDFRGEVCRVQSDYFQSSGHHYEWSSIIGDSERMKSVADELEKLLQETRLLLEEGRHLVAYHDALISHEYKQNASEMSLYEREREIERTCCADDASDEQHCYVYTLECPIGVFYVGIAADPQERYDQHLRGAYSNEEHFFKSKIIRKYGEEVIQKVIHEGTRRECRLREKAYIAEHNPLGNMTVGGEG